MSRTGDTIELTPKAREMALVLEASKSAERDTPDYLEVGRRQERQAAAHAQARGRALRGADGTASDRRILLALVRRRRVFTREHVLWTCERRRTPRARASGRGEQTKKKPASNGGLFHIGHPGARRRGREGPSDIFRHILKSGRHVPGTSRALDIGWLVSRSATPHGCGPVTSGIAKVIQGPWRATLRSRAR